MIKNTSRIIFLLIAVLALALCAACDTSSPSGEGGGTATPENRTLELAFTDFVIMRSDTGTKEETDVALQLRKDINELCGIDLQLQTDWVKRGEEVPTGTAEIIVGNTNRRTDDTLRLGEWSITREGSRIYILGGSAEALAEAKDYFVQGFLLEGGTSMKDGFTERHMVEYPVTALTVDGKALTDPVVCDIGSLAAWETEQFISLLGEKTGMKVSTSGSAAKANIIVTNQEGFGIEKGNWGISVADGKLYIVGRTKVEMKKAFNYLLPIIEAASGTLEFKNESGKAYMHTEKQMSAEEYLQEKRLVIYPEYPEMILRNYDYSVSVTMDKDTHSLPVYDHVMQNSVKSRALNGDLHRRFSQFAFSGGQVRVDIKVKTSFKSYSVVPSAKAFKNEFKDGVISVWLDKPDYFLIMLDDDLNSIISIFADDPEFPDELPDRDDPNVLYVEGIYQTEDGFLDILDKPGFTIYIAPGAVLNCRVNLRGNNASIIGHGAMVDPFENIYDYSIENGGTEGKGHTFLSINSTNGLLDGFVMLDARSFNVNLIGSVVTARNVKILSTMMTSDGISTYASGSTVEHCFIYNGDNSLVIGGVKDVTYKDVTIGTTCSAIFPQGTVTNAKMSDIYVFRVGEGIFNVAYNPNETAYTMDFTIDRLDCTDLTYLPYFFRGYKMRQAEKHFVFNDTTSILPLGTADPHVAMSSRSKGTNYFFVFPKPDGTQDCDNFILDFKNLYVDGKAITSADQLDNSGKQFNNPMTFTNDGKFTPVKKNAQTVNYTAPNRVFAGTLQLQFSVDVQKDGTAWLLPADEIKSFLRKQDAKITTVKKDGVDYVKSTDLVSAGMAAKVEEKDGALVITPVYNGGNVLLPDSGWISFFTERVCYQVDMVTEKDTDGSIYYSLRHIKGTAGLTRFFTDEVKMYGAGKYKLTFKVRSDLDGKIYAGDFTDIGSGINKSFNLGPDWAEYSIEFVISEAEAQTAVGFWIGPNASPYVDHFDVRDITLVKVG